MTAEAAKAERPLYKTIHDALAKEIAIGVFPVGSKLPTEQELCSRFSASRHTVRDALRQLQDSGVIFRRQGSGSVVASRLPPQRFVSSVHSVEGLIQYAAETKLEILTVDKIMVEKDLSQALGCSDGSVWLRVSALRRTTADALPFSYTEIYIAERFGEAVEDIGVIPTAIYRALEQRYAIRIAAVHQTIEATTADRNLASRLAIDVATPILRIVRRYISTNDELVEIAVNAHPSSRFQYNITLEQHSGDASPGA